MRAKRVTRCYVLALRPNPGKAEAARYAVWWQTRSTLDYVRDLFDEGPRVPRSTAGLGKMNNRALKNARDLLRAWRAAARATGTPLERPTAVPELASVRLGRAKGTLYSLWVKVIAGPYIPAQSHRGLSRALRAGAVLNPWAELRIGRHGGLVARVFVEYPQRLPAPTRDVVGVDVGVNVGAASSDGRCSPSLQPILDRTRARNAERCRQGHRRCAARSSLKQHLDREARRAVTLAARTGRSIAIERLKTLGNLKPTGRIGGWARRHFGQRVLQIGEELGVAVVQVHPAYTSQTCLRCDYRDRENRRGIVFECRRCGARGHADVVAARNIQRKATGRFPWEAAKAGIETRSLDASHRATSDGATQATPWKETT